MGDASGGDPGGHRGPPRRVADPGPLCVSARQPFAELIVSGRKTVLLSRAGCAHRGRLLVHAPAAASRADCERLGVGPGGLPRGAIVGSADLYGVREYASEEEARADEALHMEGPARGRVGLLLRGARRLRAPVPCPGRPGLFRAARLAAPPPGRAGLVAELVDDEHRHRLIGRH